MNLPLCVLKLYIRAFLKKFLLSVRRIQGARATQGRELLNKVIVWAQSREEGSADYADMYESNR